MRLKLLKSEENLKTIMRLNFYNQNVKDGIQIQVYYINDECVTHFSQFISEKVKKNLRKSQAQFREKLRKLRLRQNYCFLIKKRVRIEILKVK